MLTPVCLSTDYDNPATPATHKVLLQPTMNHQVA